MPAGVKGSLSPASTGVCVARWRPTAAAGVVSAATIALAVSAWACVPIATVTVTPSQARPGEEVTVSGIRFVMPTPVTLRFGDLGGPVVATLEMPRSANTLFTTTVTVPPDARPGPLVIVATQDAFPEGGGAPWGIPARAVLTVLDAAGTAPPAAAPPVAERPVDLLEESVSFGSAVLVTLGVAALALLVVGGAALLAGRRPSALVPVTADGERAP
jgi:hypothetical protein